MNNLVNIFISYILLLSHNLNAQSSINFDCIPISFSDTLANGKGEYYYQYLNYGSGQYKCYGQFLNNPSGEKIPYGKHLRYYSGTPLIDENRNRINKTDTNKVVNVFNYDSLGNLEWDVLFNYNNRNIQRVYYSPPQKEKNIEKNICFTKLLSDTMIFEGGEYYYIEEKKSYLSSKKHKYYGRFIRNGRKKIPVGKHLKFYFEETDDEYGNYIGIPDTFRVHRIDYFDENGNFQKSVAIYYSSRTIQYISCTLIRDNKKHEY